LHAPPLKAHFASVEAEKPRCLLTWHHRYTALPNGLQAASEDSIGNIDVGGMYALFKYA